MFGLEKKMIESNATKNKHLTLDDRVDIQTGLNQGLTFKAIEKKIGKDQTTVSKEVKKHLTLSKRSVTCQKRDGTPVEEEICPRLLKTPFVCNPCSKRHGYCSYQKRLYHAKAAQEAYESLLSEAREGIPLNKEEFYQIDAIITQGIQKGQHLYHILKTYDLGVSQSSVYRHLHLGYLSVSSLQFPRVVKFKQRRKPRTTYVSKAVKIKAEPTMIFWPS